MKKNKVPESNVSIPAVPERPTTKAKSRTRGKLAPRKDPAQERSRETVNAILDSAQHILESKGVDELTTHKIAAHAGVGVGSVYDYFSNKHGVLHAMLERWLNSVNEALEANSASSGRFANWMEYIDSQISGLLEVYDKEPGLAGHYGVITAIPALRNLDARQDQHFIQLQVAALKHFFPNAETVDLEIVALAYLVLVHNLLKRAVTQPLERKAKLVRVLRSQIYTLVHSLDRV
jgi:AcrR family transcriptional regulator